MFRWLPLLSVAAILLSSCVAAPLTADNLAAAQNDRPQLVAADAHSTATCAVTQPFQDEPPDDPNADPFGFGNWHINAERTIWVGLPPDLSWHPGGEKVIWIRPAGTELAISGQRLDGEAPPLRADIPCCYPTGFQVTGLHFPTEGCWEVTATAGDHELRFITQVTPAGSPPLAKGDAPGIDPDSPLATAVLLQECSETSCALHPVDPATGQAVPGYAPMELGRYAAHAFSHDRRTLALVVYLHHDANGQPLDGLLKFVDLQTWRTTTTTLTFDNVYEMIKFSPEDERLLIISDKYTWPPGKKAHLIDVAHGAMLAQQMLSFHPTHYDFTPDGAHVMLFGTDNGANQNGLNATAQIALLDAQDLSVVWTQEITGLHNGQYAEGGSTDPHNAIWWQPAVVFAPDKAALYVVHADEDALTTVDFTARTVQTRPVAPPQSWIERLLALTARTAHAKMLNGTTKQAAISPDGALLYVAGVHRAFENEQYTETPLGVQVIDLETATEIRHIDTTAQSLSVAQDGSRLYLHCWTHDPTQPYMTEWTEVLDTATFQPLATIEDKAVAVARRLDGQPILLSAVTLQNGQTELAALEPETFNILSASTDWFAGYAGWVIAP